MQKVALRKILISIFTILVVIITTFATTYAWVGILNASSIDQFKLNLKVNELNNYKLLISPTEDGEFTESVDEKGMLVIKKQILSNMGINVEMLTDQGIESEYNRVDWQSEASESFKARFAQLKSDILASFDNINNQFTKLMTQTQQDIEATEKANTVQ